MSKSDTEVFREQLQRLMRESHEATELAEQFCASPIRKKFLAVTYVCPERGREPCVLAYVYNTLRGIIVHHPPYKLSAPQNAASSSEDGRRSNTLDGDRRWKARSYFIDQAANITLNCDHLRQTIVETDDVIAAVESDTRKVIVTAM